MACYTSSRPNDRAVALKIGYAATDWDDYISYEDYEAIAADWDLKLIVRDDTPIGAIYSKNGETHVSILPEWRKRWLTKGLLKEILADMQFTKVAKGHDFIYNILERLGFKRQSDGTVARESEYGFSIRRPQHRTRHSAINDVSSTCGSTTAASVRTS